MIEREAADPARAEAPTGSCTANCSALPTTDPHARITASAVSGSVAPPNHDQRRDHRGVPHHRRRVRQQKAPVTVQDAEAPGRQHQQAGAGKQNAHELNRQLALGAVESRRDQRRSTGRGEHADEHQQRRDKRKNREHGAGDPVGSSRSLPCEQRRVDGDERRRQHAFAEQILQEVRDAERGVERVGRVGMMPK